MPSGCPTSNGDCEKFVSGRTTTALPIKKEGSHDIIIIIEANQNITQHQDNTKKLPLLAIFRMFSSSILPGSENYTVFRPFLIVIPKQPRPVNRLGLRVLEINR
jgi:hypothetical protein